MYTKSSIVSALCSRTVRLSLVMSLAIGAIAVTMLMLDTWGIVLAAPPIEENPVSLEGPTTISGASQGIIRALIAADLDTDGHADLAFGQANRLMIQAHVGVTTTQWAQTVTVGSAAYAIRDVAAVDLDQDGAPDLISASADDAGNSQISLWQNPALPFTNSWAVSRTLATTAISLTTVATGDLDRNGTPDLVSGGLDGELRFWSNPLTGTQPFDTAWTVTATIAIPGDQIAQVLIADVDRDGKLDLVEAADAGGTGVVRLWRNPGGAFTDTWAISNTLSLGSPVASVGLGDLDNDGAPDVVAGLTTGEVVVWRNPLTGTQLFTTAWSSSRTLGDLDQLCRGYRHR